MARRKTRTLTELELEIMREIWERGEVTVEDIRQAFDRAGKPLALPSIRTMLSILQQKGYVTRRPFGRGHAYRAIISADQAQKRILKDIIERAFDGSALSLVSAMVNAKMVSSKDLARIRRLIAKREKETKR